jgi:hypothetical protein
MEKEDSTDESKYTDLNDWLGDRYPGHCVPWVMEKKDSMHEMQKFRGLRCLWLPHSRRRGNRRHVIDEGEITWHAVGDVLPGGRRRRGVEMSSAPALCGLWQCSRPLALVAGGLRRSHTHTYTHTLPGDQVEAFSLATSIGSCVVTSTDKQLLSGDLNEVGNRKRLQPLCAKVLEALNV